MQDSVDKEKKKKTIKEPSQDVIQYQNTSTTCILKNIDVYSLIQHVYLVIRSNDINNDKDNTICLKEKNIKVVDSLTDSPLPKQIRIPCWWCRHQFNSSPIGCPIRYINNSLKNLTKIDNEESYDYYETEGIFCSFSCVKAYILDKKSDIFYKDSLSLLTKLYNASSNETNIKTAHTWKILKSLNQTGILDIKQFRNNNNYLQYKEDINMKRPFMFPINVVISNNTN